MSDGWRKILRLGITTRDAEDDKALPLAQTKALGRTARPTAILQPYGLHVTLPKATPGVLARWLGYRESRFFLPTSWRLRKKDSPVGDVVLYQPEKPNNEIILRRDGSIEIRSDLDIKITSLTQVKLTAPDVIVDGDFTVTGEMSITSGVLDAAGQDIGENHTHGGVTTGGGTSGGPNS